MINLLPPEYKKKGLFDLPKQWLLLGGVVIVLIILLAAYSYTSLLVEERIAKKKLAFAESKLSHLRTELKTIENLKTKKEKIETQLEEQKEILGTKLVITPILESLQEIVSDDSWVASFNVSENNQFEFIGYALNNQEIGTLFRKIKAAPKFKDVSIDLVKQQDLDEEKYTEDKIIYYRVTGSLVNEGGANSAQLE